MSKNDLDQETLVTLVLSAYYLGEICEGAAMKLLDLDRLDFRMLYLPFQLKKDNEVSPFDQIQQTRALTPFEKP